MILFLAACQTSSSNAVTDSPSGELLVTHIAELSVEGMVCEMGCAADIRKALKETGGIADIEIDFEKDREVNLAVVKFDASMINADQIRNSIELINKGQFKVKTIETQAYSSSEGSIDQRPSDESSITPQMNNHMISLSEIVGIVASLFI